MDEDEKPLEAKVSPLHDSELRVEPEQVGSPSDFLKNVVGRQVLVRLNSGVDYRGRLLISTYAAAHTLARHPLLSRCEQTRERQKFSRGKLSQGYMNIAMEQTEELVNGKITNSFGGELFLKQFHA